MLSRLVRQGEYSEEEREYVLKFIIYFILQAQDRIDRSDRIWRYLCFTVDRPERVWHCKKNVCTVRKSKKSRKNKK